MDFDIAVSRNEIIPSSVTDDLVASLRAEGLRVEEEERENEVFGALEWLVPTAIIVFIAKEYVGTLLQEAAKDHYPKIKQSLSKLVSRTTGAEREVKLQYMASSPGKVDPGKVPITMSVISSLRDGRRVKFVFEHELTVEHHEQAVGEMFEVLASHFAEYPEDRITTKIPPEGTWPKNEVIMRFDGDKSFDWVIVDIRPKPGAA